MQRSAPARLLRRFARFRALYPAFLPALALALVLAALVAACGQGAAPSDVLRNQVLAEIHADVRVAPYEVQVEVTGTDPGHVVLSGDVDRPEVKKLAEELALNVEGVDVVVNQINVRGPRGVGESGSAD